MRYKCIISYDGTNFHGFQTQLNKRTVQEELEKALFTIHKEKVNILACSRTDSHVHALGQVIHFDSFLDINEWNMKQAINSYLPSDIYVKEVFKVNKTFHAQHNVIEKEYHYLIDLGEYNPLYYNYRLYPEYGKLDIDKMIDASLIFIGTHDFKTFTKNHETTNTIKEIKKIDFIKEDNLLTIKFIGNSFLYNMIRIMVAMLLEVGYNHINKEDLKNALDKKDRKYAPKLASPNGLYLIRIKYENE